MKVQLDAQVKAVDQLKGNTRMLENKLSEAKSKQDTLKARAKSASTSKQINEMLQGLNTSSASSAFDRMEEKVMALEGESEAAMQVMCTHAHPSGLICVLMLTLVPNKIAGKFIGSSNLPALLGNMVRQHRQCWLLCLCKTSSLSVCAVLGRVDSASDVAWLSSSTNSSTGRTCNMNRPCKMCHSSCMLITGATYTPSYSCHACSVCKHV